MASGTSSDGRRRGWARVARSLAACAVVLAALVVSWRLFWRPPGEQVVVYCAHDQVFAADVFREFTRETGIAVAVRYDSEATKSLGLIERLIAEAQAPRCDVLWNNELLGTMDLARRGLLEPYIGASHARIPTRFRAEDGAWAGFAARVRVVLVDRRRLPAGLSSGDAALDRWIAAALAGDLHRAAMAKPLYGTTLTHYSVLWNRLGGDALRAWHRDSRARGLREADGNGMVKELVVDGACDLGFTDSDDAYAAIDAGAAVAMAPVRIDGHAILIPNTAAIVRGAPHQDAARKLVDFLLSERGELLLARSASRQVPLGTVADAQLAADVRQLREWTRDAAPLDGLLDARNACLEWLKQEYAQ